MLSGEGGLRESSNYPSFGRAGYTAVLLVFASLISVLDAQALALLVKPIKLAFALSDTGVGLLQGTVFSLSRGLAGLPVALLVDRGNRVRLIGLIVVCWSIFTGLTGACTHLWQLFACRMGVAVAESGFQPAAYSLIADLYPPRRLASATLAFYGAILLSASGGIAFGGAMIGWIAEHAWSLPASLALMPVWRLTFFAAALPGLVIAFLFFAVREPTRKRRDSSTIADEQKISLVTFLRANWDTFTCLFVGITAAGIGIGEILMWLPAILDRAYGFPTSQSGEWLGLTYGIGSVSGLVVAALLTRVLRPHWGVLAPLQVLRIGALTSALVLPGLFWAQSVNQILALTLVYFLSAFTASGVSPGLTIGIAPNHLRGRIIAILGIVGVAVGMACPVLVGALSDHVFRGPHGLLLAFCVVVIPVGILAPVALVGVVGPFRRTMNLPVPYQEV